MYHYRKTMTLSAFRITRFQFARDRMIGDSQVAHGRRQCSSARADCRRRPGRARLHPDAVRSRCPTRPRSSASSGRRSGPISKASWRSPLANRVSRPRGGNQRASSLPFREAIQVALWDLAAKQAGLPLHRLLGSRATGSRPMPAGSTFISATTNSSACSRTPPTLGYRAFKIKVGHPDFDRDLHRLDLLKALRAAGRRDHDRRQRGVVVQGGADEDGGDPARRSRSAVGRGSDPAPRLDGLRMLRRSAPWTQINSGEYLDLHGKRLLLEAQATDILNVHGQVSDVMRIGWLAADMGIPVSLGNTFLEVGVHMAVRAARGRVARIFVPELRPSRRRAGRDPATATPMRPTGPATGWCSAKRRAAIGRGRHCSIRPSSARPRPIRARGMSRPTAHRARLAESSPSGGTDMRSQLIVLSWQACSRAASASAQELTVWDWKSGDPVTAQLLREGQGRRSRRRIPASPSTTSCSRTTSTTRCSALRCRPMPVPTCS